MFNFFKFSHNIKRKDISFSPQFSNTFSSGFKKLKNKIFCKITFTLQLSRDKTAHF